MPCFFEPGEEKMSPLVGGHGACNSGSLGVTCQHFAYPSIGVSALAHRLEQVHGSTDLHLLDMQCEQFAKGMGKGNLTVFAPFPHALNE